MFSWASLIVHYTYHKKTHHDIGHILLEKEKEVSFRLYQFVFWSFTWVNIFHTLVFNWKCKYQNGITYTA